MTDEIKKENTETNDTPNDNGADATAEKAAVEKTESKEAAKETAVADKDVAAVSPADSKDGSRKFTPRAGGSRPPFKKNFRKRTPFKREKPEFFS